MEYIRYKIIILFMKGKFVKKSLNKKTIKKGDYIIPVIIKKCRAHSSPFETEVEIKYPAPTKLPQGT